MLAAASHDTALGRHYWTLAAHPGRFRITDAVRDLDEDWGTICRSGLHAGDRFAVWKYKCSDAHRGIVAFGEILTEPAIREDDPEYWNDPDAPAAAMRVLVRYVIKPEPLWHELAPHDSVIRDLPVSRSQGGTVHHVSPDQW